MAIASDDVVQLQLQINRFAPQIYDFVPLVPDGIVGNATLEAARLVVFSGVFRSTFGFSVASIKSLNDNAAILAGAMAGWANADGLPPAPTDMTSTGLDFITGAEGGNKPAPNPILRAKIANPPPAATSFMQQSSFGLPIPVVLTIAAGGVYVLFFKKRK